MANKSWHLDRRTFLRGSGVSLAVPLMSGMTQAGESKVVAELPRRLCCFYFPFGVCQKPGEWDWFPSGEGADFKFSRTMKSSVMGFLMVHLVYGLVVAALYDVWA